jgi:hypothetical protein
MAKTPEQYDADAAVFREWVAHTAPRGLINPATMRPDDVTIGVIGAFLDKFYPDTPATIASFNLAVERVGTKMVWFVVNEPKPIPKPKKPPQVAKPQPGPLTRISHTDLRKQEREEKERKDSAWAKEMETRALRGDSPEEVARKAADPYPLPIYYPSNGPNHGRIDHGKTAQAVKEWRARQEAAKLNPPKKMTKKQLDEQLANDKRPGAQYYPENHPRSNQIDWAATKAAQRKWDISHGITPEKSML